MAINSDPTRSKRGDSFKELIVWRRAVAMSVEIYRLTSTFPSSEQFGLTSQMRRAAVSVASNIAEGYGRSTRGEYILFLGHARGSNCELETQLLIASELKLGNRELLHKVEVLSGEVGRMLVAMMAKLRR
ncbi:four helix bundle protein [Acidobacteria bacterium AB60]|nr:four helix bundle protein [Acidobacteria bacterium AB60]